MHVTGLPANEARAGFYVVVAFRPAKRGGVLEGIVDVLKGNKRAVANIGEWANRDRRQGVGKRTEGAMARGKAHGIFAPAP